MTTIKVFAAYATLDRQTVVELDVAPGTTAGALLQRLSREAEFASLDLERVTVGIFGTLIDRSRVLAAGDRVELLRPLEIDPKTERRLRARRL